jgi:hypothetical protein
MSYKIIPDWTYLGMPVYTQSDVDLNNSVPVAVAMPIDAFAYRSSSYEPIKKNENLSLEEGARLVSVFKHPINEQSNQWFQDGFRWEGDKKYGSPPMKVIIPPKFMIYIKNQYQQKYNKLGYFVRLFYEPSTRRTYYYFSENPERGYERETDDLFYDPIVTPGKAVATKKGGRKTRKYRKK